MEAVWLWTIKKSVLSGKSKGPRQGNIQRMFLLIGVGALNIIVVAFDWTERGDFFFFRGSKRGDSFMWKLVAVRTEIWTSINEALWMCYCHKELFLGIYAPSYSFIHTIFLGHPSADWKCEHPLAKKIGHKSMDQLLAGKHRRSSEVYTTCKKMIIN